MFYYLLFNMTNICNLNIFFKNFVLKRHYKDLWCLLVVLYVFFNRQGNPSVICVRKCQPLLFGAKVCDCLFTFIIPVHCKTRYCFVHFISTLAFVVVRVLLFLVGRLLDIRLLVVCRLHYPRCIMLSELLLLGL